MTCFFGCFRYKEVGRRKTHLISKSISSKNRDPLVSSKRLTNVFLCEEKGSPCVQIQDKSLQENFDRQSADDQLKDEVKFLKSCGALLETPAEIRKTSEKAQVPSLDGDEPPSNFHSRLSDTPCKKLHWDEEPNQVSHTPLQVHEYSDLPQNKSEGCPSEEYHRSRKAVRFEGVDPQPGVESVVDPVNLDVSPETAKQIQPLGSKDSPYPTPLNLTKEMQTPGTVYASKQQNIRCGENGRIQTRYVYPVLNPMENLTQWKMPCKEDSHLIQLSRHFDQQTFPAFVQDSMENSPQITLTTVSKDSAQNDKRNKNLETAPKEEVNFEVETPHLVSSLSSWLRPPPSKDERWNNKDTTRDRSPPDKSADDDRPIIGIVAAHWNEDEPSRVSPKWFDGNGIPNSTNKYKEDQKVSWHATPFEERLEKALSDEKLFPQRKLHNGRPIEFEDDGEENDTAASKFVAN